MRTTEMMAYVQALKVQRVNTIADQRISVENLCTCTYYMPANSNHVLS